MVLSYLGLYFFETFGAKLLSAGGCTIERKLHLPFSYKQLLFLTTEALVVYFTEHKVI
jgi:hypothetical protein